MTKDFTALCSIFVGIFAINCNPAAPPIDSGVPGSEGGLTDAMCLPPTFPDASLSPPDSYPCLWVTLVSSNARCVSIGGAHVRFRTDDAGAGFELSAGVDRTSVPPTNIPYYSANHDGCRGAFTLEVEHPDYEPLTVHRQAFADRNWMGNGRTEIVMLELTPRRPSGIGSDASLDGN